MDKESLETVAKFSILGSVTYSLPECISRLNEDTLDELLSKYEVDNADALASTILSKIPQQYVLLTDYQEKSLNNLTVADKIETEDFFGPYDSLYDLGLAFPFLDEDRLFAVMPVEVKATFAQLENREELDIQKERNRKLFYYTKALCSLYGVFGSENFVSVFNQHNKDKVTDDEYIAYIAAMVDRQNYFGAEIDNDSCIVWCGFDYDDEERMLDLWDENEHRTEWYMPTKTQIKLYAAEGYEVTPEFTKLEEYVTKTELVKPRWLEDFFGELHWQMVKDDSPNELLDTFTREGAYFRDATHINELMQLVSGASNAHRKWCLHGFAPNELFAKERPFLKPPPNTPLRVVKVGRNDTCSCGSGKKYKKCCGV